MFPASGGKDRDWNVSISLGGNLAKSLLTSASLHWSPTRSKPSLCSEQRVCGADKSIVELIDVMELLLESGISDSDWVVGARLWSVVGRLNGFVTDMLTIPKIEQKRSAMECLD